MGALPNAIPAGSPRKQPSQATRPAEQAKGSCKPREWKELDRLARAGTDYDQPRTGFVPLFHAFIADLCRLASGASCWAVVTLIFQNLGRNKNKETGALPLESSMLLVAELATLAQCDERQVNRVLEYLAERKMAVIARFAGGKVVVRLLYRDWPNIKQSYREWLEAKQAEIHDAAIDEPEAEAPVLETKAGTVQLTKSPQTVKAGHRSRAIPVTTGVRFYRVEWQGKGLDMAFTAAVESGELVCKAWEVSEKEESNTPVQRNQQDTRERGHICPDIPSNGGSPIPTNVGSTITGKEAARKVPVFHPRAAELCNLFDDSLLRWCRKTLSGDPQALAEACQAIQDVPHDWLVKAAVTRCGKTIGSPRSVPAICKEIHHNWSRGKALPEAHRIVSAAEIDAIVAKERAELAAQRRQYALDTRERMRRERERNR